MLDFIKSKNKPKLHGRPKPRDPKEVSLQYNKNAIEVGHKIREIAELKERVSELETQILDHVIQMRAAHLEARNTPQKLTATPKAAPAATPAEGTPDAQAQ